MNSKRAKKDNLIKVAEKSLLSSVAERLKDRNLFPEKIENAKAYLKDIVIIQSK